MILALSVRFQLRPSLSKKLAFPPPRSQAARLSTVDLTCLFRRWHSQTTAVRQPRFCRSSILRRSLAMLFLNFTSQNSARVAGTEASSQLGCRCQKQPCTKHAAWSLGNTRSGLPGRLPEWSRYLNPLACRAFRRVSSGLVSLLPMRDIIRERVSASTVSAMITLYAMTGCTVQEKQNFGLAVARAQPKRILTHG